MSEYAAKEMTGKKKRAPDTPTYLRMRETRNNWRAAPIRLTQKKKSA